MIWPCFFAYFFVSLARYLCRFYIYNFFMENKPTLLQFDFDHDFIKEQINNAFVDREWVTLYSRESIHKGENDCFDIFRYRWTYIINPELCEKSLESYDEDIRDTDRGALYGSNGSRYYKPYVKEGIEPLVTILDFFNSGSYKKQIRIHEDFIYMFNLYEEVFTDGSRDYSLFDCGEKNTIMTIRANEVKIKHRYLKTFLAAKRMNLVCIAKSECNCNISHIDDIEFDINWTGSMGVTDKSVPLSNYNSSITQNGNEFQNWFYAKRIIKYDNFDKFASVFDSKYEEYIIGYNTDTCKDELVKCNDEENRYTRVYFKKAIIDQYRNNPTACIEALRISTRFFSLRCDNDNLEYVSVFLKDLMSLPYEEQQLWKKYNISPSTRTESELFHSVINGLNWGARATSPDFRFRDCFNELQKKWQERFGWVLFKPTTGTQQNIINRLVVLGSDNSDNFIDLIASFNLVLSESINVEELDKAGIVYPSGYKSIAKLKHFLSSNGVDSQCFFEFLGMLNSLRSKFSKAHRQGSKKDSILKRCKNYFGINVEYNNYKESSVNMFSLASEAFEELISLI